MSRFFAQLLLSVLISVSAAVGFSPDVRGEWNETWREAKAFLRETADTALGTVGHVIAQVNTAVSASAQANARASTEGNAKVDAKAKGSSDTQVMTEDNLFGNLFSGFSMDDSVTADSQTNAAADTQGPELNLKNRTKSTLDFSLDR